ncbi:nucleic acid/nucleotide deaminase domain-containing protein [Actinospica robiniae]|uniref:nucleic acid/nucleotide deaminase domain-containing protein n=1 Tax=Actinospica robiniae TaxID=304901 RepID=UPI00054E8A8D|nr:nucleic acid/nucleotide deaminase domain-containing protein [Actinospica robiniae]
MTSLAEALAAQFGAAGLRTFDAGRLDGLTVSASAAELLSVTGLPARVGTYFTAAGPGGPLRIVAEDGQPAWLLLGGDQGASLAADLDGAVHALLRPSWGRSRPVNRSIEQLAASLAMLDRYLPLLAAAAQSEQIGPLWNKLRSALAYIDPDAQADPECWWALVLEDIRHVVSFPFSAAAKFVRDGQEPQVLTASAVLGLPHPELQLARRLAELGVDRSSVTELYTELQACRMPGHYCGLRAAVAFPRAQYTYAFPYGEDAQERQESVNAAALAAATAATAATAAEAGDR